MYYLKNFFINFQLQFCWGGYWQFLGKLYALNILLFATMVKYVCGGCVLLTCINIYIILLFLGYLCIGLRCVCVCGKIWSVRSSLIRTTLCPYSNNILPSRINYAIMDFGAPFRKPAQEKSPLGNKKYTTLEDPTSLLLNFC